LEKKNFDLTIPTYTSEIFCTEKIAMIITSIFSMIVKEMYVNSSHIDNTVITTAKMFIYTVLRL